MDRGGIPAIVFLILYFALCSWVSSLLLSKQVSWRSRYTSIFIHTTLRLAAQICGIGYAVAGVEHSNWLVAYFVFGAEGYFTLVWCAFRFLISFQNEVTGNSWIEPKREGMSWSEYYRKMPHYPVLYFHYSLAGANALIIVGSLKGMNTDLSDPSRASEIHTGVILRDVGTALFMAWVLVLGYFCFRSYKYAQTRNQTRFLFIIGATVIPLLVRGVYGILACEITQWNYALPESYDSQGLKPGALAAEYLLGTTMEWSTCLLLLCTSFISLDNGRSQGSSLLNEKVNSKDKTQQDVHSVA
ncbi:LAFE_0C07030g1_1 [Lachancea fermentati]|uniref:LAFE_0C07030g1_1 n=1 Tax=Lachancea fermentati TaxID=4955 RepID=A0A1G4M9N6_LACFM|nr:LAFE_0C07030g1_1 [Lachancea fermentati]